jgi:hypothetical protein
MSGVLSFASVKKSSRGAANPPNTTSRGRDRDKVRPGSVCLKILDHVVMQNRRQHHERLCSRNHSKIEPAHSTHFEPFRLEDRLDR